MPVHLIDSRLFGGSWGSDELRQNFDEEARLAGWLEVLVALAEAQAELGIIPRHVVPEIRRVCQLDLLDVDRLDQGFRQTGHSLQGLLTELARLSDGEAADWICFGATVQDITDSWLSRALLVSWRSATSELGAVERILLDLAREHRSTPMLGRTHGQGGLPITFGYKVAVWARELRRHLGRLAEIRPRLGRCQLGGGVGAMHAFGDRGFALQHRFAAKLGLEPPTVAWISARDTLVEYLQLLSLIAGSFDKIGHEIYNLQRPEIGELREGAADAQVGSITMPHKRNPEVAEHLGTLARMIRHHAAALAESQVHEHERDGRSWKLEWAAVPPACVLFSALLEQAGRLLESLEVDAQRMTDNLGATRGLVCSEGVMLALAHHTGRLRAHALLHAVGRRVADGPLTLRQALESEPEVTQHLDAEELDRLCDPLRALGQCRALVDRVLDAAHAASEERR